MPKGSYVCVTCEAAIRNPYNTEADATLLQDRARDLAIFRSVLPFLVILFLEVLI